MKKFFADFKAFIKKGNIVDMAVGVIIGSAFSAIVTSLTQKIFMPLINWLLSIIGASDGLESAYTFLSKSYNADGTVDFTNSIYIDWGAFISAIINFFIIAMTLFLIVKIIMKGQGFVSTISKKAMEGKLTRAEIKELKTAGIDRKNKEAVKLYFDNKKKEEEKKQAEEEEKKRLEEEEKYKNSPEYLLKEIRDILKENKELSTKKVEAVEEIVNQE